jgi:hypothetical protein
MPGRGKPTARFAFLSGPAPGRSPDHAVVLGGILAGESLVEAVGFMGSAR